MTLLGVWGRTGEAGHDRFTARIDKLNEEARLTNASLMGRGAALPSGHGAATEAGILLSGRPRVTHGCLPH